MDNLAIKHGYYFVIDRNDNDKYMTIEIGPAYRNDDLEKITIKSENGFIKLFMNDKQESLRDQDLSNPFEYVADGFINKIIDQYTKMSLVKRVNDVLVPYFEEN